MPEPFDLQCDALGSQAALVAFRGTEGLSAPYEYDVFASVPQGDVPSASDAIHTPLSITVHREQEGTPSYVHGLIRALQITGEHDERTLVQIEVVPQLWDLSIIQHSRVFTEISIPDVIRAVLEGAGLTSESFLFSLDGSYEDQHHVCQYKESDLAFITRLMEHEGMYYFFEHQADGHRVVITDHRSYHQPSRFEPVRYHPVAGGDLGSDSFDSLVSRRSLQPASVTLTDYDYENPGLAVEGEAAAAGTTGAAVVEHGARCWTPAQARRLATLRAEQLLASEHTLEARGTAFHLRPGYRFELSEHPRLSGEYQCLELRHVGNLRARSPELRQLLGIGSDEVYAVHAIALDAKTQFRPPRQTPKPRVDGLERAMVDGPADSEYAQIDDQGRYRVKFAFDESELSGGEASVAVRMMQPHAGNPEGFHFPLRKGTEVLVAFLAGDPDRPVIAGAIPNAETPSPITNDNSTRNIIRTGGNNEIEIEDDDGNQWIDLRSPTEDTYLHLGKPYNPSHYIVGHTQGNCRFKIGTDQDIRVGGELTEKVTGSVTEIYKSSQTSLVKGAQTTIVSKPVEEDYTGGQQTTTTKATTELYASGQKTTVSGGQRNERFEADQTSVVVSAVNQTYSDGHDFTVSGPSVQMYNSTKTNLATGLTRYLFDSDVTQIFGDTTFFHIGTNWTIPGAANVFTSKWEVTAAGNSFITNMINSLKMNKTEAVGVCIGIAGSKYEACGINMGATGLKVELTSLTANAFGAALELKGVCLEAEGDKTVQGAFKKEGA